MFFFGMGERLLMEEGGEGVLAATGGVVGAEGGGGGCGLLLFPCPSMILRKKTKRRELKVRC